MVSNALSHGTGDVTSFGLFRECLENISQCWILEDEDGIIKGCAITRLNDVGLNKGLKLFEHFAKGVGCKHLSMYGRKGWSKILPKEYKQPYQIFMKEL